MYATPLVAAVSRKRWLSVALQPAVFFSALDPPYFPLRPGRSCFAFWARAIFAFVNRLTQRWVAPWHRVSFGVEVACKLEESHHGWPVFPFRNSGAIFTRVCGSPTGLASRNCCDRFCVLRQARCRVSRFARELADFIEAGTPPIVFTLGSSAVFDPGRFYEVSAEAASLLRKRAVLLAGPEFRTRTSLRSNDSLHSPSTRPILSFSREPPPSCIPEE